MSLNEPSPPDESLRQRLYGIVNDEELSLAEKRDRALAVGLEFLGVENGHIQRRDGEDTDTVVASVGEVPGLLPEGTKLDRATTYCRRTVQSRSPVALSSAPDQGWADDPAYREHGFDCYLGTTIYVDGDVYGTVCFVSRDARDDVFTDDERAFVELVARLLGRAIETDEHERRLSEERQARQRTEHKYEALLNQAPDAVFLTDADTGEIVEANEAATDLTGHPESELEGMEVFDLHPEENCERYRDLFEGGITDGLRDRFDDGTPLYIRRADGTDVPVEISANAVEFDDRVLMQGIVRDISARREREREIERQRDFLRQTQEAVDLGGWEVDLRSGDVRWTDEIYRIHDLPLDYTPTVEESIGFYHPEDRPELEDAFQRLVDEGEPYDTELRLVTFDGEVRWVRSIGLPCHGDDGEVVAVRGVFQDITDRKERERALRVRNRAIDEASVGVTIADATDDDQPLVYVNGAFERLTGYDREEAVGKNCRFLQGPETDEGAVAEIREAVAAAEPVTTELLNYRADGTPFWNELTVAPVTNEAGEVTHYVGFQQDVTARKRRDRLIEVFDRVLRHNIRNDMTVVKGFAEVVAERSDDAVADLADRIVDVASDLTALSEQARKLETVIDEPATLEPRDVVADIEAAIDSLDANHPDTEFTVVSPGRPRVVATERLGLALAELGEIAAVDGPSPVTYEVDQSGDGHVAVRVRDAGAGLSESSRAVLEKGRETPLEHSDGLGLWLVNWIVTGAGGDVSIADDGATVTLHLPAAPDSSERLDHYRQAAISTRL